MKDIEEITDDIGLMTHQAREAFKLAVHNLQMFDLKQADYGPLNISGNPHPALGVAFRAGDKVQRLMHLYMKAEKPNNESVEDSWSDLANYALIGGLLTRGLWEGPED